MTSHLFQIIIANLTMYLVYDGNVGGPRLIIAIAQYLDHTSQLRHHKHTQLFDGIDRNK